MPFDKPRIARISAAARRVTGGAIKPALVHAGDGAARPAYIGKEPERAPMRIETETDDSIGKEKEGSGREGVVWSLGSVGMLETPDRDTPWESWDGDLAGIGAQGEWVEGQAWGTAEALGALSLMSGGIDCYRDHHLDVMPHGPVPKGRIRCHVFRVHGCEYV